MSMASIFTFDPDPPRVASPWTNSGTATPELRVADSGNVRKHYEGTENNSDLTHPVVVTDALVTRLPPEPQDGPVEYKLHLLLRPRRSFHSTSTADRISGSARQGPLGDVGQRGASLQIPQTPPLASSSQSRQHRLEQLTTQLLWRLQQSSPHHASASKKVVLASLPRRFGSNDAVIAPQRVPHGLEESRGALYEIGVADDGTFVGLLRDELDESLQNLRMMAATLGCSVDIIRNVAVGTGEWYDDLSRQDPSLHQGTLWVAEAFVKPNLEGIAQQQEDMQKPLAVRRPDHGVEQASSSDIQYSTSTQLRITLTGPTMSGKSSLLGNLTSGALDNGRGKSRLGLLKHRHEIVSGMTSSVTQELIGYAAHSSHDESSPVRIINYGTGDVASWSDIHALCEGGRLLFFSDSAGHPRYRRTTVRGLVGWAPHWTLLCIPADSADDRPGMNSSTPPTKDLLGCGTADIDLLDAHLQICLTLRMPLLIAITKLDQASRSGLKQLLGKLLTNLKAAGRRPILLRDTVTVGDDHEEPHIPGSVLAEVQIALPDSIGDGTAVPIICTSAVTGAGIGKLHALLHELPVPRLHADSAAIARSTAMGAAGIFHVEDVFGDRVGMGSDAETMVVSGILRGGSIAVGDLLYLGPFSSSHATEDFEGSPSLKPSESLGTGSRCLSDAIVSVPSPLTEPDYKEWRQVKVVSLRNLRLPVRGLREDQVGTLGFQPVDPHVPLRSSLARVRKGMVLSSSEVTACSVVEAEFSGITVRELSIGSLVVVYTASVRATARVVLMSIGDEADERASVADVPLQFSLDYDDDLSASQILRATTIVHLKFVSSREYIAVDSELFMMPGGGPGLAGGTARGEKGLAGLEGFAGRVIRVTDSHERLDRRANP